MSVQCGYMLQAAGHCARAGWLRRRRRDGRGFAFVNATALVWWPRHAVADVTMTVECSGRGWRW